MADQTPKPSHFGDAGPLAALQPWLHVLVAYVGSKHPDLTNRQLALLMVVYLEPGPHTVRGLAARLGVSKPVVTRILNTLGSLGYLRRQKDASDLRNIFVEHMPDGRAFLADFAAMVAGSDAAGGPKAVGRSTKG